MRKIRARNGVQICNAILGPILKIRTFPRFIPGSLFFQGFCYFPAPPGNKAVDPLVVGALGMRIPGSNAYKLPNAYNALLAGRGNFSLGRVAQVADYAAISAGQPIKDKVLPELFEELKTGNLSTGSNIRFIPAKTVSGTVLMPAFRPEKVEISGKNGEYETCLR